MMVSWGINRFSVSWKTERKRHIFDCLDRWGYTVNFYDVPDLEAYLQAALLLPTSLTSDFNFPRWHYFGRGSGEGREHHEYRLHPNRKRAAARSFDLAENLRGFSVHASRSA